MKLSALTAALVGSAALQTANAWGVVGHEVVATIAQIHLQPSTLPNICRILNFTSKNPNEPQCHLAPIATWADKLRYKMRWSASMHYIGAVDDHPSQTCAFPGPRGWESSVNVLGAIRNDTSILETWVMSQKAGASFYEDDLANEALKFLVHFVGDMHQPLHLTGRDRGGNSDKVLFDGRQYNLHSVWDNALIAKTLRNIPYNYTRPLPIEQVEYNLRGTIYDPWIRRIMWEGLYAKWKSEAYDWLSCPSSSKPSSTSTTTMTIPIPGSVPAGVTSLFHFLWQQFSRIGNVLLTATSSSSIQHDNTDDDLVCPYHWAKAIHPLNCELIWPKELDEPPYKHLRLMPEDSADEDGWVEGTLAGKPKQMYLELDTPEYAGRISKEWILEKLMAQAGIRLAGILNWLFADEELGAEEFRRRLMIALPKLD